MVDTKPEHHDHEESEGEEEAEKRVFKDEDWMTYIEPSQARTLITKRWITFSSYIGIYYIF